MPVSNAKIKLIQSLKNKKYRKKHGLFFIEGEKNVKEVFNSDIKIRIVAATETWLEANTEIIKSVDEYYKVTQKELQKISFLKTPEHVLVVAEIPDQFYDENEVTASLCLGLERINDPGNLGTIVRLADWFGISHIFCSPESVDIYNPKAVQATMGAISRMKVHYADLNEISEKFSRKGLSVFGTFLEGQNIYKTVLPCKGLIIFGSESHGISKKLAEKIDKKLFIPNWPKKSAQAESLNIAMAASIVCSEFRREFL